MQKYILILAVFLVSGLLGACSTLQFPGVYKVTIEQGNVITQEMVDQLKPGMSREQVEYIMGSPIVKDTFNEDRWDYIYSIQRGDKTRKQSRLSIFFKAGSLDHFTGDFVPSSASETPDQTADDQNRASTEAS